MREIIVTARRKTTRRGIALLLTTLVVASWGVGVGVPAGAQHDARLASGTRWILKTRPVTVVRDGERYKLRLTVKEFREEGDSYEQMTVTVWSRSNPAGVSKSVQTHDFDFDVPRADHNKFLHNRTLTGASITGTGRMGGEREMMHVAADFDGTGELTRSCDGHLRRRTGRLSGSFTFNGGQGPLGDVTELSRRAVLIHHDGQCQPDRYTACRANAVASYADRDGRKPMTVEALRADGAETASITVTYEKWGEHEVRATVPASHVRIAEDLSSVTIRGASGTYLKGTLAATADSAAVPGPPINCGANGTDAYIRTIRLMTDYEGDLTARYWIGPDVTAESHPLPGNAARITTFP